MDMRLAALLESTYGGKPCAPECAPPPSPRGQIHFELGSCGSLSNPHGIIMKLRPGKVEIGPERGGCPYGKRIPKILGPPAHFSHVGPILLAIPTQGHVHTHTPHSNYPSICLVCLVIYSVVLQGWEPHVDFSLVLLPSNGHFSKCRQSCIRGNI